MRTTLVGLCWVLFLFPVLAAEDVLMVADELPAMEVLAKQLQTLEGLSSRVVTQKQMPASLAEFRAVIVYIHLGLDEPAEQALIAYTRAGGRLIPLHHSISSGKRKNRYWFEFLGVTLPEGDVEQGGYKWIEPASLEIGNLAPNHFITTNQAHYPARVSYPGSATAGQSQQLPGFALSNSEVYLNHRLVGSQTRLLGFRYRDAGGKVWSQDHAGWARPAGKGWIVYFMPGHSASEFEVVPYARLIANAIIYRPD